MSRSPIDTGPVVSTDFAYVTDGTTTGVISVQSLPTAAQSTLSTATVFVIDVAPGGNGTPIWTTNRRVTFPSMGMLNVVAFRQVLPEQVKSLPATTGVVWAGSVSTMSPAYTVPTALPVFRMVMSYISTSPARTALPAT